MNQSDKTAESDSLASHLEALLARGCTAIRRKRPGPHNPEGERTILIATNPASGGGWSPAILEPGDAAKQQWRDAGLAYPFPISSDQAQSSAQGVLSQKPKDPLGTALRNLSKTRSKIHSLEIEQENLKAGLPVLAMRETPYVQRLAAKLPDADSDDDRNHLARAILRRVAVAMAAVLDPEHSDAPRASEIRQTGLWNDVDQVWAIEASDVDRHLAVAKRLLDVLDTAGALPSDFDAKALSQSLSTVIGALT